MTLAPGTTLGSYEILSPLGAGGMGEVYRARDTKLGREVAIKTLPDGLAADGDRMARFEREARALAALNHPNVATLHGFFTSEEIPFLVMELVPGETLAERISRGPIPLDEALQLFLQIAEGLEAAHAQGVIHRDLKPANIKIISSADRATASGSDVGQVKILDFGLAKAMAGRDPASAGNLSQSPTLTLAATQRGEILGTAAYMSPEQAKGLAIDQRTDVWAFGACLLEAISGTRAFKGKDASELMASVLMVEPDWESIPATAPESLHRLLRRCLEKDARQRLHDIADVRIAVSEAIDEPPPTAEPSASDRRKRWPAPAAVVGGLIAGALLAANFLPQRASSGGTTGHQPTRRATLALPPDVVLATMQDYQSGSLAISPDGSTIVFMGRLGQTGQLYQRPLDSHVATPIADTYGAYAPFFSPDSQWVAYLDAGELKKVSVQGGEPLVLTRAHLGMSGTWSDDGWIYFTHHENRLARVGKDGGDSTDVTTDDSARPHALPGGRGVLVSVQPADFSSFRADSGEIVWVSSDGDSRTVLRGAYDGRYIASGHLLFYRGRDLFAAPFDLDSMTLAGAPVAVLDGILTDSIWGAPQYDIAADGTLVFAAGGDLARTVPTWIDRQGHEEPLPIAAGIYNQFSLSPDERRLAIQVAGAEDQIHIWDNDRSTLDQLTLEGGNFGPVWNAAGDKVYFHSTRSGADRTYVKDLNTGVTELVLTEEQSLQTGSPTVGPIQATPDGQRLVLFSWGHPTEQASLWLTPADQDGDLQPLVRTTDNDILPTLSPGGKWMAFLSNRTGPYEVYVRPFDAVDARERQISSGNGDDPRWSPLGDEIFYRAGNHLMSVRATETDSGLEFGPPKEIWEIPFHNSKGFSFEVSDDAQRFLVNRPIDAETRDRPIRVIFNWFEELQRLVPTH